MLGAVGAVGVIAVGTAAAGAVANAVQAELGEIRNRFGQQQYAMQGAAHHLQTVAMYEQENERLTDLLRAANHTEQMHQEQLQDCAARTTKMHQEDLKQASTIREQQSELRSLK